MRVRRIIPCCGESELNWMKTRNEKHSLHFMKMVQSHIFTLLFIYLLNFIVAGNLLVSIRQIYWNAVFNLFSFENIEKNVSNLIIINSSILQCICLRIKMNIAFVYGITNLMSSKRDHVQILIWIWSALYFYQLSWKLIKFINAYFIWSFVICIYIYLFIQWFISTSRFILIAKTVQDF